jgi:replicative DNA helicase
MDLRMEELRELREGIRPPGVPVPWESLNRRLGGGGFEPGLHILVGSSGSFKSQFGLQVAMLAAVQGHPAYMLHLEMKAEVIDRMLILASNAELYWSRLREDTRAAREAQRIGAEVIRTLPIRLDVGAPYQWSYDRFGPLLDQWLPMTRRHTSPPLLVVDYVQLIGSPADRPREDARSRVSNAVYALQNEATKRGVAVLAISSTARGNYYRAGGTDQNGRKVQPPWEQPAENFIGMGKESGEAEYSAKTVMYLVKQPWGGNQPPVDGTAFHLAVAKTRGGVPGWVELRERWGRFSEVGDCEGEAVLCL